MSNTNTTKTETDNVVNPKLTNMVNNIIDEKPEQAELEFHNYLQTKLKSLIRGKKD